MKHCVGKLRAGKKKRNKPKFIAPYRLIRLLQKNYQLQIRLADGNYKTVLETKEEDFLVSLLARLYGHVIE